MSGLKWQAILGCLVVLCTLGGSRAFAEATPYQQIIDRNVFALKPPAPPPKPEDNRPPPPNIKMTGIITLLGQKRVLLKLQPPPKPGAKAEEESFILASGERQGEVEVLEIDEKNGIVKVNDYGTITNLTWENNGVKVAAAPPPVPNMGAGGPNPNPGAFNPAGAAGAQHGGRVVPTARPVRPGFNPAGTPGTPGAPGYSGAAGGTALPGLGGAASPIATSKNWPPENYDSDVQTIMDAAYKQKNARAIANGELPDLPSSSNPLLPNQNQAPQPQQQQNQNGNFPRGRY
jgi:hypothetical protein